MIITYPTGKFFDYENITKESIDIEDIIHSLTGINRFNGYTSRTYSVGEHSLMCLLMAEKLGLSTRLMLLTLIHDFTEAYVGDCPAPLKQFLPEFISMEVQVESAICEKFNIEPPTLEEYQVIKSIDLSMLLVEMKYLTVHNYTQHINENIHTQFLEDEDFNLHKGVMSRENLKDILHSIFTNLLKDYHGEL